MTDMIMVSAWSHITFTLVLYYSFPLELPKIEVTDGREFIFESCHPFSTRRRHFHSSFNMRRNVLFNFLLCLPAPGDQAKINSIFMQDKVLFSESKPGYCPLGFLRSYIFPYLNQWLRKDAYDNQSLQVFTLRIKYVVLWGTMPPASETIILYRNVSTFFSFFFSYFLSNIT